MTYRGVTMEFCNICGKSKKNLKDDYTCCPKSKWVGVYDIDSQMIVERIHELEKTIEELRNG